MASLDKKPITRTAPKTGQRVKAKSKKWRGRYRDATGVERRAPLAPDKSAAQTMLNAEDVEDRTEWHRRRFEAVEKTSNAKRKKPRQKRGFSRDFSSVCITQT